MIKYALILFMVLFIGCGGGSSDSNSSGGENLGLSSHVLDTLSLDETKMVENSLRNANYDNVSNLVKLSSNIVSFNHEKNGVKYYTVLNTKTSEVLTNIKNFQGTSITSVTKDTITYDNKQKVDVKEYTQSSYQPKVSYANPKEIIQEKIGYNKRVDKFVYTPQKGGAIVLISAPGGWTIYKYGLENPNNPVREGAIASSDDDDVVTEIKTYSGGKMSYKYYTKMSTNKQIHEVFYDYFNMKKISGDADYQIENNSQSSISFSDTDVENAAENRGVEFYKGYRKLSNGKYLVLGADHDGVYSVYTFKQQGGSLVFEKKSKPILVVYRHAGGSFWDVNVWIDSIVGDKIVVDFKHNAVGETEYIIYNYVYDTYVENTTNGVGSADYSWEEYLSDRGVGTSSQNYNDDVPEYKIREAADGYVDHIDIANGSKVLILSKNGDSLYRLFTYRKQNGDLVYEKISKIIINAHQQGNDVSVWINGLNGNNIMIGYRHNLVGINEQIVYNYVNDYYVSNTTNGAGSIEYTWEDYVADHNQGVRY